MGLVRFILLHEQEELLLIMTKIKRNLERQKVVLKGLNSSSNPGKGFFDEVGSCHLNNDVLYNTN